MYIVRWKRTALDQLASLWTQGDSSARKAIATATNQIDRELKHDPANKGESREERSRVLFVFPLGVLFRVNTENSTVRVLNVWSYKRRG